MTARGNGLAYETYRRLREQERQAHIAAELPDDLAEAILANLDQVRASGQAEDGDTIIG